jgi:hypothetical protein
MRGFRGTEGSTGSAADVKTLDGTDPANAIVRLIDERTPPRRSAGID